MKPDFSTSFDDVEAMFNQVMPVRSDQKLVFDQLGALPTPSAH